MPTFPEIHSLIAIFYRFVDVVDGIKAAWHASVVVRAACGSYLGKLQRLRTEKIEKCSCLEVGSLL